MTEPQYRSILVDRKGEMSVTEAAKVVGCDQRFIRKAIKSGALPTYIPGGRTDLNRLGPGMGYRIKDTDLAAWWYGVQQLPSDERPHGPYGASRNPSGKKKEATK